MKFYRLSDATFYDCINTIYQFIKSFLDYKCLFLRNMEPLKQKQKQKKIVYVTNWDRVLFFIRSATDQLLVKGRQILN